MLRALILIAALLAFRAFLPRKSRRSPTEISPYMNSLDGLISAQQISAELDKIARLEGRAADICTNDQCNTMACYPAHE